MVYTKELGEKICERTANSSVSLMRICEELGVAYYTVAKWIHDEDHELHAKYAKAKQMQLHHLAGEILEIADNIANNITTVVAKDGKMRQVKNKEAISRSKLRIEARKILISKLSPILRESKINPEEKITPTSFSAN